MAAAPSKAVANPRAPTRTRTSAVFTTFSPATGTGDGAPGFEPAASVPLAAAVVPAASRASRGPPLALLLALLLGLLGLLAVVGDPPWSTCATTAPATTRRASPP